MYAVQGRELALCNTCIVQLRRAYYRTHTGDPLHSGAKPSLWGTFYRAEMTNDFSCLDELTVATWLAERMLARKRRHAHAQ